MYSWDDDFSDWANPNGYAFKQGDAKQRQADAAKSAAAGPRTYAGRRAPDLQLVDPKRHVSSKSKSPMIVAVDVTASMAQWPAEIFDRLPLFYKTLAQYRPDLEVSFVAVGDARAFIYPLQASDFCRGFELESRLNAIYPEGLYKSSIDPPESYGLLAYWANHHVKVPNAEKPFLIVFGDITMHPTHPPDEIERILGDRPKKTVDSIAEWRRACESWNVWFLRSPRCWEPENTDRQWSEAIGAQKIVHIDDEPRAVDYAMGLVARTWGHFDDFKENMSARQDAAKIEALEKSLPKKV